MTSRYIQKGASIDFKNATEEKINAGDMVAIGKARTGIAATDIVVGATGTVAVEGVFAVPKDTSTEVKQGDALYFNAEGKKVTKTDSDVPAGWAVADAATADTEVLMKLEPPAAAASAPAAKTKLEDLEGVEISDPQENQVLTYKDSKWKNQNAASEAV